MRKSFKPEDCIAALNNLKKGLQMRGLPFTSEQLRNSLRGCGLPTNNNFFAVFKASGIVQEVSKGKYMFADDKPIYVGTLHAIKRKYGELCRKYMDNHKKKVAEKADAIAEEVKESKPQLPDNDPKALTQFAIDLLKEQGYEIFAPVGIVYKKL